MKLTVTFSEIGILLTALLAPSQAYDIWFYNSQDCTSQVVSQCKAVPPGSCCTPDNLTYNSVYMNCNGGDSWNVNGQAVGGGVCDCVGSAVTGRGPACITESELGSTVGCAQYAG